MNLYRVFGAACVAGALGAGPAEAEELFIGRWAVDAVRL